MTHVGLILVLIASSCLAAARSQARDIGSVANPQTTHAGWVTDESNVLGPRAQETERRLSLLKQDTGAEVAVVILKTIDISDPRAFAINLFNIWGVGQRGVDNGVVVLHVLDRRRLEIEVGYGLEGTLPDAKCKWLIEEVAIPFFRAGDLAGGHAALVAGLDYAIRKPKAGHDELIAKALGRAQLRGGQRAVQVPTRVSDNIFTRHWFLFALLGAIVVQALRARAHRAYHRASAYAFDLPWGGWLVGILIAGWIALVPRASRVSLPSLAMFAVVYVWVGLRARQVFRAARARYAARTCAQCQEIERVLDQRDEKAFLSGGQQTEKGLHSIEYDVWRCDNGHVRISPQAGANDRFAHCSVCNFRAEERLGKNTLRKARPDQPGLDEESFKCAHCGGTRSKQWETTWSPPEGSSQTSSSSHGSSESSSSSGSFGGGRSGGAGAGGSY